LHKLAIALVDVKPMKDVNGGILCGMKGRWQIVIGRLGIDDDIRAIRRKDRTQPVLQNRKGRFAVRAADRQVVNLQ
jgi:hypothetical protein